MGEIREDNGERERDWVEIFLSLYVVNTQRNNENSKPSSEEKKTSERGFDLQKDGVFLRSVTESWGDVWVKKYKLLVRWATEGGSRKKKLTIWKIVGLPHILCNSPPLPPKVQPVYLTHLFTKYLGIEYPFAGVLLNIQVQVLVMIWERLVIGQ